MFQFKGKFGSLKKQRQNSSKKTLIADISNLSSTSRIEAIAVNELAMRKATSSEIMRVEVGR
jgi:cell division protein FtsL